MASEPSERISRQAPQLVTVLKEMKAGLDTVSSKVQALTAKTLWTAYILSSPDPTMWEYTGYVVVALSFLFFLLGFTVLELEVFGNSLSQPP